ncbi:MAG: sigma-70 family RNA polymerase sigma factor [Bacteroidetes bacterium]|nr:MAG: sigma-70 family RNA polymerase sigma factor [Bacteroidota bacterium]
MSSSEHEIIEQILSGNRLLYSQLVEEYKNRSMTLAMRILKNREEAEEAVQDAFVRAYNALSKFERRSKFSTWLYRIIYNVCLSKLNKRQGEQLFVREQEYDDAFDELSLSSVPSLDYETKELITIIQSSIDELPPKYGTILSLFYFQELSYEEISEVTRLPLGTVKTHLFRARARLIQRLTQEYAVETIESL